ncbi:MAG: DNA polymerase III subunit beta [Candidatus Gracilibacteria bacterium]|nr:DNA polymerase III subunit beta [Candidatus Gracilibacteria bacterium]
MRFRIGTLIFRKAIEAASHATGANNLTPILENILIEAGYKKLTVTGNNLEMAIEYIIEDGVDVEVEGKFTISSKFLTSYIALIQDDEVTVELEKGGSLRFATKGSDTKFKGASAEKFPVIPSLVKNSPLTIETKDLKVAIEKTLFSTADGAIRPVLAGIYLKPTEDALIFASTDSFRLSELRVAGNGNNATPVIIPKKTAQELLRIVNEEGESNAIELYFHENQLLAVRGNIRLSSRLLSGKFPEYDGFFPKEHSTKTTLLRNDLTTSLKQANLVARENNYNTRIRSKHEGVVEISTGDTEVGASSISLTGSVEGHEEIIGINAQYLLEVLSVMKEDYISFEYKSALSPIVIKGVPAEDGKYSYRHLIMPLKI